jgi:hypothetical protein
MNRLWVCAGWTALAAALAVPIGPAAGPADEQWERGRTALAGMTGCYLVDYSYVETESLQAGYRRDGRVYDVNRDKSVKEWIWAEPISPRRIWLQRVLFITELGGAVRPGSVIRHQAEDWEYEATFLYEFVEPRTWQVKDLRSSPGLWTRRVTNLDDGLRHQCAARWRTDTAYPEWSCSSGAPIPGRETRDMGRTDYHALERTTRIVVYGGSWLERQNNVKVVAGPEGRRALAREIGKNWYVRLPDEECAVARAFARPRQAFWTLRRETWDGVLNGRGPFVERAPAGEPPRFVRMQEIEERYIGRDLADPEVRSAARDEILRVIGHYREP